MRCVLRLFILASLALSIVPFPAPAQTDNTKTAPSPTPAPTKAPAVEVDPDAAKYSTEKKYVPPGAMKSVEIGNFYLRRKKYKGAISRFNEAIREDSGYAPAYLGLGRAYENTGLKQKALEAYKQYLDTLPTEKAALEAKDVQRAVARLEQELKTPGAAHHGRKSSGQATPPSQ
jgi:tetratricopeptide (TPR) repeat protein